jgi:hypothetical protein
VISSIKTADAADAAAARPRQDARMNRHGWIAMITQRQIDFRNEYRSRIVGWYNGYFHIALIYAMGAAVLAIYIAHGAQIRHAPAGQHQGAARHL